MPASSTASPVVWWKNRPRETRTWTFNSEFGHPHDQCQMAWSPSSGKAARSHFAHFFAGRFHESPTLELPTSALAKTKVLGSHGILQNVTYIQPTIMHSFGAGPFDHLFAQSGGRCSCQKVLVRLGGCEQLSSSGLWDCDAVIELLFRKRLHPLRLIEQNC